MALVWACDGTEGDPSPKPTVHYATGGQCLLPAAGTPVEKLPGYPVGYGVQPNIVASTFLDQPYEVVLGNDVAGVYSSVTLGGLIESPSHGTFEAAADGIAVYTPEPGFSGTDEFVFRVDYGPPAGAPLMSFAYEQHDDGGGAELGRVLIRVIPSEPIGLPSCEGDCVDVDVLSFAGFGYPVQFLTSATHWQSPGYPDAPPCEVEHWQPGGIAIQNWGVTMGSTGHAQFPQIGDWSIWSWDPAVFGDCSEGEIGTVRYLAPNPVSLRRDDFEQYCRVMTFVRTGAVVDLVTDDEIVTHYAEPLGIDRDWPLWIDDEVTP